MRKTLLQVLLVVVMVLGGVVLPLTVQAAKPVAYEPTDVGPRIREWEPTPDRIATPSVGLLDGAETSSGSGTGSCLEVIDTKIFMILNDYTGYYEFETFLLVAEDDDAQLWLQADLAWPDGDPRETPVVTCEQAEYMLAEFTGSILPQETAFFGPAAPHDGSLSLLEAWGYFEPGYYHDPAGRPIILVSNVRDDNYYDPSYPNYIAGFYSPSFEAYFDRNVITIDAYDWANRVGPDGSRPYLYEGTVAHEYQHLLHDDYDSDEETWLNEALSEFAEFLCGYGHPDGHVAAAMSHPENSLVLWGDQGDLEILSDYGHAYLFALFLYERYGGPFIQALFGEAANGISGVNAALDAFRVPKRFADLYADWSAQLLIDAKTPAGGRYEFETLDETLDIGTPDAPNPQAFDSPGVGPWATDYIWIQGDPKELARLCFNGVDYAVFPTEWTSDGEVLWSGTGDLIDNWAIFQATGGGTLTFDTLYDMEDYWDFGFVQVSTDGGYTWTSLSNDYTTAEYDPNAHPTVVANLPGLTSYITEWMPMEFSLAAYAGQDILIAFRHVTDWATHYGGWYVDNVYVDDTLISDGTDASVFKSLTEIIPVNNNFSVTFVGIKPQGSRGNQYRILTIKLDEATEEGWLELDRLLASSTQAVMLVTFEAPEGHTAYADYTYDFTYSNSGKKK